MESESVSYPWVRRDVIGSHGEVEFSLVDIRDGEVVATWVEVEEAAVWDEDCFSNVDGNGNENAPEPQGEDMRRIDPFGVYVGNLDPGVSEEDLVRHFSAVGEILRVTLLKGKKNKGLRMGAAFICFAKQEAAECALLLEGSFLRGAEMIVREKLITFSDAVDSKARRKEAKRKIKKESEDWALSNYIGNLDHRVTSLDLASHFSSVGEVRKVEVVRNRDTGEHMGAAYVQFKDLRGLKNALSLDGTFIAGKIVRIKKRKRSVGLEDTKYRMKRKTSSVEEKNNNERARNNFSDDEEAQSAPPKSSQVYVGNLGFETSKEDVEEHFKGTGDIVRVIIMKKGKVAWAFIQFQDRWSVEGALCMDGTMLKERKIKVQRKKSSKKPINEKK